MKIEIAGKPTYVKMAELKAGATVEYGGEYYIKTQLTEENFVIAICLSDGEPGKFLTNCEVRPFPLKAVPDTGGDA